jgi:hypothetical protein
MAWSGRGYRRGRVTQLARIALAAMYVASSMWLYFTRTDPMLVPVLVGTSVAAGA